ncbi:MAG: divergent polysaccharide deacetylase family protein [Candidatus Omnitrophica bacterium]|nr:divergent polysaccharide deacetylase family protein [Candidatus Omnitrophota bacterium]
MARRRRSRGGGARRRRFSLKGNTPLTLFLGAAIGIVGFWLAVQLANSPLVASIFLEKHPSIEVSRKISAQSTRILPSDLSPEYHKPIAVPVTPKIEKTAVPVEKEVPKAVIPSKQGPRVAIVIDDIGYHDRLERLLFSTKLPLTLSIMPQLEFSTHFSREGKKRGYEIILHQPMEPEVQFGDSDPGMISTWMNKEQVQRMLKLDLSTVPDADGMNNHMGSKATENAKLMRWVFEVLKERNLFFLDSVTSAHSLGWATAQSVNLPHLKRNVFLDNEDNPKYIENQIWQLLEKAKTQGFAIGIGHYRQTTLDVLKRMAPKIKKQGVEVVSLKDLLKQQ